MQLNSNHSLISRPDYWAGHPGSSAIVFGALQLSPISNRVQAGNTQISLRPLEFRLLHFFMTHPDEVHTREQLLKMVWGDWIVVGARTVDVHIRRLRASLQPFGLDGLVQTVHCRGYLFSNAANQASPAAFIN